MQALALAVTKDCLFICMLVLVQDIGTKKKKLISIPILDKNLKG